MNTFCENILIQFIHTGVVKALFCYGELNIFLDTLQMKAIKTIQEKGQIKRKNPNSVKVSDKATEKVKAVLDKSLEEENGKFLFLFNKIPVTEMTLQ